MFRISLNIPATKVLSVANREYFKRVESPLPPGIEVVINFDGEASIHPKAIGFRSVLEEGRKLARNPARRPSRITWGAWTPRRAPS